MRKKPEQYLKEPYARILIPDEEGNFSAEILEFPGCFAQGDTADEALRNLERAAISWIDAALHLGQKIPPPSMNQGYGGRIALRLPRSIHRRASQLAERDNTSLNQFILSAVAAKIGAEDFCSALVKKVEHRMVTAANTMSLEGNLWNLILHNANSEKQMTYSSFLTQVQRTGTTKESQNLSLQ